MTKEFFDIASNQPVEQVILNNACLKFIFWDNSADAPCTCQDNFRRCNDINSDNVCNDDDNVKPISVMKVILAIVPDSQYVPNIINTSDCRVDPNILPASEYIRIEKKVFLSNIN